MRSRGGDTAEGKAAGSSPFLVALAERGCSHPRRSGTRAGACSGEEAADGLAVRLLRRSSNGRLQPRTATSEAAAGAWAKGRIDVVTGAHARHRTLTRLRVCGPRWGSLRLARRGGELRLSGETADEAAREHLHSLRGVTDPDVAPNVLGARESSTPEASARGGGRERAPGAGGRRPGKRARGGQGWTRRPSARDATRLRLRSRLAREGRSVVWIGSGASARDQVDASGTPTHASSRDAAGHVRVARRRAPFLRTDSSSFGWTHGRGRRASRWSVRACVPKGSPGGVRALAGHPRFVRGSLRGWCASVHRSSALTASTSPDAGVSGQAARREL